MNDDQIRRDVRALALTQAVWWAGQRSQATNRHPGTELIIDVAKDFENFIWDGTVVV